MTTLRLVTDAMTTFPEAWQAPTTLWAAWMRAGTRADQTIKLRLYHVERFARTHGDPWTVTTDDLATWFADHQWATETMRGYRASLHGFYRWAQLTHRVEEDPTLPLPPIRVPIPMPRPAPESVYSEAAATAPAHVRLMLALGFAQGLRRGEIAQVHSDDLEPDLDGWTLVVHGKGGRQRRVPLLPEVAAALRALPLGFAFPGRIDGHLSPRWVGDLMKDALPGHWTAHPLRHAFATRTYQRSGHDIRLVQELLGHASVATTQLYVLTDDASKRLAVLAAAPKAAA